MARPPRPRVRRPDRLDPLVHPTTRFLWGLGLLTVLVFTPRWEVRGLVMVLGGTLALLAGKRISFSYFLTLCGTVVFFHLLAPFGKVLVQLGNFPITEGALVGGWRNGLTMAGLVFLSLGTISRRLHLPGRFGELWALTFAWYEQLMESRSRVHPRALLLSIDRILETHYPTRGAAAGPQVTRDRHAPTTRGGWALVVLTLAGAGALGVFWK